MRENIAGNKKQFATRMGIADALLQDFQRGEFIIARTQTVTWLTGIHRIGTKVECGMHFFQRTCWQEKFRSF